MPFPIHSAPDWWQDDNLLLPPRNTNFLESKRRTHNMALFAARLGRGAFSTRCNRMWLGKDLKHHKHFAQHLQLEQDDDGGWRVSWKKKFLTTLAPLEPIMQSLTGKVFILATGPSVKKENLSLLTDSPIIGCNGAVSLLHDIGLSASEYVITDRDFFLNRMDLVRVAVESGARCFFSLNGIALLCERAPDLLKTGKIYLLETVNRYYGLAQAPPEQIQHFQPNWALLPNTSSRHNLRIGWSHDISKGIFSGCTVAYIAAQVAYSLGHREFNFLGLDLGGQGRAYDEGDSIQPTTLDKDYHPMILPSFELLKLSAKKENYEIYNLSENSRLPRDILPYRTLKDSLTK